MALLCISFLCAAATPQGGSKLKELEIKDVKAGKGRSVAEGDLIYVTYVGKLADGTVFDSNNSSKASPLAFRVGSTPLAVIPGWDQGLRGMKVGGKRLLSIPSKLGYGDAENGKIPANSDLYFECDLLYIVKKGEDGYYDLVDVEAGKGRAAKKGDLITVEYTGRLVNGKLIDSTYERKEPVTFKLGVGDAIAGVDDGLVGMKVGGKRRLVLPPALLMGSGASAFIPPNQTVIYEFVLKSIK